METTTRFFSKPLAKQTMKSQLILTIVVLVISVLICVVMAFATNVLEGDVGVYSEGNQSVFNACLLAIKNSGVESEEILEILQSDDLTQLYRYQEIIEETGRTVERFIQAVDAIKVSKSGLDAYLAYFDYYCVLHGEVGYFTGENLSVWGATLAEFETSGLDADMIDGVTSIDPVIFMNLMDYHIIGILPFAIWAVLVGNYVVASQVDRGSMSFILSTPTKRSAVVITQGTFMVAVPLVGTVLMCVTKIISNAIFLGDALVSSTIVLYVGMYLLIEAMCGICYLGSCLFNHSSRSSAFGGAIVVWFFLATLIGLFGTDILVASGLGVSSLNVFNWFSLMTLLDTEAAATVGTASVDLSFLWEYAVLLVIAVCTYLAGAVYFTKKDLPI
ncbi:MAG: ABC transporter permease [Clostridia bacterium]|nr:ABC transporter permease [Clostridia bacterium]